MAIAIWKSSPLILEGWMLPAFSNSVCPMMVRGFVASIFSSLGYRNSKTLLLSLPSPETPCSGSSEYGESQ